MSKINLYYAKNSAQWLLGKNLNVVLNNRETIIVKAKEVTSIEVPSGSVTVQMSTPYFGSEIGKAHTSFNIEENEELFITYKSPFFVFSSGTIFIEKGSQPNPNIINKGEWFKTFLKLSLGVFAFFLILYFIGFLVFSNILYNSFNKTTNENTTQVEVDDAESSDISQEVEVTSNLTVSQENAVRQANNYLNIFGYSRSGLIDQLEFEGFTTEDATIAIDSMSIDWIQQASKKADSYLTIMAYSRSGLIEQLEFEGFENNEAVNGIDALNVDWFDQAAKKAKQYLDIMGYSRSGLIDQLEFEGFTHEEAVYGVDTTGL